MTADRLFCRREKNMITNDQIDRINVLYHKSKSPEGLTPEEKQEQERLRKDYIQAIRASLRGTLNNISIQEKDGSVTDLGEKYGKAGAP